MPQDRSPCDSHSSPDTPAYAAKSIKIQRVWRGGGVKKVERALCPMDFEVATSTEDQFWFEIGSNVDDNAGKPSQFAVTAQQRTYQMIHKQCREAKENRRAKQPVDTIEASHQDARSFRSQHPYRAVSPSGRSSRCPDPDDFAQCDNERGKIEQLCASRSRQRELVCKGTRISKIRKIAPGVRSSSGFAVATEQASRPRVAGKHETIC